jgi:hypothetical protein
MVGQEKLDALINRGARSCVRTPDQLERTETEPLRYTSDDMQKLQRTK